MGNRYVVDIDICIRFVFLFLLILFPVSLLEFANKIELIKDIVFISRLISLGIVILVFFLLKKDIKYPKIVLLLIVFVIFNIIIGGITKTLIDIFTILVLTIIYANFKYENRKYIEKFMCKFFLYLPLFMMFLIFVGIIDNTYYNDGQMLNKLGFNNPNYFSLILLFGFFIAYINKYKKLMYIFLIVISITYFFTYTVSVLLLTYILTLSAFLSTKKSIYNKILVSIVTSILFFLMVVFVFYPELLLPDNWTSMKVWEFRSNLYSRIYNNALKIRELKEDGFWFGGVKSSQDSLFINYWASIGIFGLLYFIYRSFKTIFSNYKSSLRKTIFIIAIMLLAMIEQTVYSTSLISILYFYFIFADDNSGYYSLKLKTK